MTRKLWARVVGILAVIAAAAGVARFGLSPEDAAVVREVGELVAEEIADTSSSAPAAAPTLLP